MCEPTTIAMGIMAVTGAYSAVQADKAREEAKKDAKEAQKRQDEQMAELNKPKPTMVDPTTADNELAAKKSKDRLRAGLFSTIKTSPLGTQANPGLKTKLGQ